MFLPYFCSYIPLKEKLCTSKLIPSSPKLRKEFFNRLDQCFVEQKNGAIVRQVVGYNRLVGERTY